MDIPETRYAKTADGVHIAYQTVGTGPVDIAFVMGWTTHIELMWKEPTLARFLSRLAAFSRFDPLRQARYRTVRPRARRSAPVSRGPDG